MEIKDKFNMTLEQNIFVAKRNIVDYIWKSANLEGINVTYPETQQVFEGLTVQGLKVNDIVAINNLKHAWYFIFDNIEYPVDYNYICKINQIVGGDNLVTNAGNIRLSEVKIGGTDWKPELPNKEEIINNIYNIQKIENVTDRSITLMLYCMRTQMFYDGNKRTSMMVANQTMIQNGKGIISISPNQIKDFYNLLTQFYETNNMDKIKQFIYENCIDGIEFTPKNEEEE